MRVEATWRAWLLLASGIVSLTHGVAVGSPLEAMAGSSIILLLSAMNAYARAAARLLARARIKAPREAEAPRGAVTLPLRIEEAPRLPGRTYARLPEAYWGLTPRGDAEVVEGEAQLPLAASTGLYLIRQVELAAEDPLGLFHGVASRSVETRLLVRPRVPEARNQLLAAPLPPAPGVPALHGPPDPLEMLWLRPYQAGDDPRLVDWKASARTGSLVAREPGKSLDASRMALLLEASEDSRTGEPGSMGHDLVFEAAAAILASLPPGEPGPRVAVYNGACTLLPGSTAWETLSSLLAAAPRLASAAQPYDAHGHARCAERASQTTAALLSLHPPVSLLEADLELLSTAAPRVVAAAIHDNPDTAALETLEASRRGSPVEIAWATPETAPLLLNKAWKQEP